ncbi:uncharacterized protein KD926_006881 [Aspergillus affinis]|uniref:uncharacterized protein n=1 Tax=Aspergillus affinis TaxID=1070780 RepID=UPI0022FECE91|nr:uncharacterized protein KD926_006881 [Aspergillus affinis]KAI9041305.1 hypothetical protein KD926_006881 [Aspergillus affinis]
MWDFYNGKSILLTGGTGFLGSTLLYRLVSKGNCGKIYIIFRGGRERAEKKWKQNLPLETAQRLLSCESIVFLDGDLTKEFMGLRDEELNNICQETQIIIHCASSIDLTSPLTRMANEIIGPSLSQAEFETSCPKLDKFVYVSSAFANAHLWKSFGGQEVQLDETKYPLAKGTGTPPRRCKHGKISNEPEPATRPTFDQVPVDVVTDRLLAHLGMGTAGIFHVSSPLRLRISIDDFRVSINRARRLPGTLAIHWEREDPSSPNIHPHSRVFVLTGTSFNFRETNTERIAHLDGKAGLQSFTRTWVWSRASEVQQIARKLADTKGLPAEAAAWVFAEQLTIDGLQLYIIGCSV